MGRLFESNLLATGLTEAVRSALQSLGVDFDEVRESEVDMGLGNGGLGRLAACFLDSLATLDYPALGYGIHYEFGLFKQEFVNGSQVEHPDRWMLFGKPVGGHQGRLHPGGQALRPGRKRLRRPRGLEAEVGRLPHGARRPPRHPRRPGSARRP